MCNEKTDKIGNLLYVANYVNCIWLHKKVLFEIPREIRNKLIVLKINIDMLISCMFYFDIAKYKQNLLHSINNTEPT